MLNLDFYKFEPDLFMLLHSKYNSEELMSC